MSSKAYSEAVFRVVPADNTNPHQDQVAELFQELRQDVYRYLLTLGLHPPQAQEATQEVFLRLYITLRKNVDVHNPRAWIFRVAHNYGLKVRAQQQSLRAFDPELESRLVASDVSAETRLLDQERRLRFHRAVENLSETQHDLTITEDLTTGRLKLGDQATLLPHVASVMHVGDALSRPYNRVGLHQEHPGRLGCRSVGCLHDSRC